MPSLQLAEFSLSQSMAESANLYAQVREANPDAAAKELAIALRAAKVQAALAWHSNELREGKDSSLPPSGTAKQTLDLSQVRNSLAEPTSLETQPKSDASTTVRYYLSLTKEERIPVLNATKLANPDADAVAFNKAYKIALWKADSLKKGTNPGQNWEAVDFSPVSDTYSEDSG